MERSAVDILGADTTVGDPTLPPAGAARPEAPAPADTVVVHVQLRPRRGSTRRCLAELAELAGRHPEVSFGLTGLSKDDRVVRVTVGVELGPRAAVARFSPQAQAAYAFVSEIFTALYDHMPVYTVEPGAAERVAADGLVARLSGGVPAERAAVPPVPAEQVPA
ncbi:hypothetical protein [Geodermatophilus marinus]|uniref:hypothetical protein n=1 Tax=Geodermatophilus sp. LHW52908 TaxID=2303986 RepID=UPI001F3F1F6E|nr:hypothetical protein [Geodermatophilus sp. LHW52908]